MKKRRSIDFHRSAISLSCGGLLTLSFPTSVSAQSTTGATADRVVVTAPRLPTQKHIHFNFAFKNAEYRRQLLACTPLGSSGEEVTAFEDAEFRAEGRRKENRWTEAYTLRRNKPVLIDHRLFDDEPPLSKVGGRTPAYFFGRAQTYSVAMGASHLAATFWYSEPLYKPWRRGGIQLCVAYVFNPQNKLVDVYCNTGCCYIGSEGGPTDMRPYEPSINNLQAVKFGSR